MPNLHAQPDTLAELMAREADGLPACIVSTTWPTIPAASMTLDPFPTQAYVKGGTPAHLTYVEQPARAIALSGADGHFWLAVHKDTTTALSGWTRTAGSHYLWRPAPTRPADPDQGLVFADVVVAGGVITSLDPTFAPQPLETVIAQMKGTAYGTRIALRVETLSWVARQPSTSTAADPLFWAAAGFTNIHALWRVPATYAGGEVTFSVFRRGSGVGGNATMGWLLQRMRHATTPVTLTGLTALPFAPGNALTLQDNMVQAAGGFDVGDLLQLTLQRDADHAGDTMTDPVANDGIVVSFFAFAGRP